MKKIEIITRPFILDELKDTLTDVGIKEIIVTDIRCSSPHDNNGTYLHEDYFVEFLPKIKVEFYAEKVTIATVKNAVKQLAENEESDDTRIYAYDVEEV